MAVKNKIDSVENQPLWQKRLRKFFQLIWVELCIGLLVVISVGLTLYEVVAMNSLGAATPVEQMPQPLIWIEWVNDLITLIFTIELTLRFFAAQTKKQFFMEFWLDILAVIPQFRAFRAFRAMRLLRLFRILRFFGVATRIANHFPSVFRRGTTEYLVMCGLLIVTVIFSTVLMMSFERASLGSDVASERFTFENSFWFSIYSLFAGEPTPMIPSTRSGRIVAVFVMFMGLTIFAMFTGTVSAYMVETFRVEKNAIDLDDVENHIIICGWNTKTEIIIKEYRASRKSLKTPIVVIADVDLGKLGVPEEFRKQFLFIRDDFTRVTALQRARIHTAKTCIILADIGKGRSEQDADARTILAALTCESLNPQVYTCAELMNRSYGGHLDLGRVNDYVVSGEYAGYMLAQSAMNHGLMGVLDELMTHQHGQVFHRVQVPNSWAGKDYLECMIDLKKNYNSTLVAVQHESGEMTVNPEEHTFEVGDEMVIMSKDEVTFPD